jgi:DNA-binding NarL/FixJ family response regulator
MDIHDMPDVPALLAQVRSRRPDIRTLLIGAPADHNRISALIAGGAKAYLEEFLPAKQILEAIRVVAAGSIWAPRKLLAALIDRLLDRASEPIRDVSEALTEREQQVLLQIMAARSNREIAESLGIEERTVKSYVAKLMKKTGAENRLALSMHSLAQVLLAQKNEDAVRAVTQKPKVPATKGH